MFFKILKNDLRRKRTMNAILLLLIILASTFLAGSANNLYTTMGAIDYFCDKSDISDFMVFSKDERMDEFLRRSEYVTDFDTEEYVGLNVSKIRLNDTEKIDSYAGIFLFSLPKKYALVFDSETDGDFRLKDNEIAICVSDSLTKGINKGDTLTITSGNYTQKFKVAYIFKDAAFGSQSIGIKRFFVSDDNFMRFYNSEENIGRFYNVKTTDINKFSTEFYKSGIDVYSSLSVKTIKATFNVDMMTAAVFIVVSLALIIISFVILNFTIGYTISEDYKEIGIMKAIGMKNGGIKKIYLVKYIFFALIGAAVGLGLSVPFGNMLNSNLNTNMCLPPAAYNIVINLVCAPIIVLLVTVFSIISAGRLNKLTAMQAIRSGMSGESYSRKSLINLHKRKFMKPKSYMAINDILNNFRQYISLFVTFTVGTALIIIPLNIVNTLKDGGEMITMFGYKPADVYIMTKREAEYYTDDIVKDEIAKIEREYKMGGLNLDFDAELSFGIGLHKYGDEDAYTKVMATRALEKSADNYRYTQGTAPIEANELALTEITANEIGAHIGDYVVIDANGKSAKFIVTGVYQCLFNIGRGVRLSQKADTSYMSITGTQMISADFPEGSDAENLRERMKEITPDYIVRDSEEFVNYIIGNIVTSVDAVKVLVILLVLGVNCLVTVLVSRMLFARDMNSIAMLKSIGFTDKSIRGWQMRRIIITLVISVILGIGLSMLLNAPITGATFGLMGANKINVVIKPLEVFAMYPVILLAVTIIAACLATTGIKKIDIRNLRGNE